MDPETAPTNPTSESEPRSLLREVERLSGARVSACYQCHKCSSGCPIAEDSDWLSSQVMRLLHLGADEEVLSSRAIWLCSSCEACTTRCPMDIDVAAVMDALRMLAVRRGAKLGAVTDQQFARAFLNSVQRHGRVFELEMLMSYKIRSGTLLTDLDKGLKMFLGGKLRLLPNRSGNRDEIREVFARAAKEEAER